MKKYICLILSIVMMVSLCMAVNAQGTAALSGADNVGLGQTTELTLSLSGVEAASSVAVEVSLSDSLELVSGTFLKDGMIRNFDLSSMKGAAAGLSSPDVNGGVFKLVVKGKTLSSSGNVLVIVTVKNGSAALLNATVSKTVGVVCAAHDFGGAVQADAANHSRTCKTCGYVEKTAHTWGSGIVTQQANCKTAGTMRYDCTACGATKVESIPTNSDHKYGDYKSAVAATCTTAGTDERFCIVCNHRDTRVVPAIGHKLQASSKIVKAPTCTENGVANAKCSLCSHTVSTTVPATGHKLGEYTVIQEPTCTDEGVKEGVCTACGEKSQLPVSAKGHYFDEGVVVKEATTTESGTLKKTCTFCGATEEEQIPQLSEKPEETPEETPEVSVQPEEEEGGATWIIFVVIGAVVLLAAAVIVFIVLKKKKAAKPAEGAVEGK